MIPRRAEDYRTMFWMFVCAPLLIGLHWARPQLGSSLLPFSCYFAIAAGVIAHNHMHRPTFRSKRANELFSGWISILYGYPVFAWLPTHNLNHHKMLNRRGDATITWRYTNKHNVWVASSYFFVSAYFQSAWIKEFIGRAFREKPVVFRRIVWQYVVTFGTHTAAIAVATAHWGLLRGLWVWALSLGIPAFSALWTIMLFNYCQHVHTDPWSKHDHSRNFEGRLLNYLLFGNGFHTVHHEQPSLHWADAMKEHAKIRHAIDPRLCEPRMLWFFARQYLVAPFFPRLGTSQVGRAPFDDGVSAVSG